MDSLGRPILIAGAGISGLTAALCLARSGFSVELIERTGQFDEVGAGLQLSPNASRILIGLGLEPLLAPQIGKPDALIVRQAASGRVLADMPLGVTAEKRWGAPMWVAHRADLQAALVASVREEKNITLLPGTRLENILDGQDGASADLINDEERRPLTAPLLLAADGLWSQLRLKIEGGQGPRFSGRSAYRATVPMEQVPPSLRRNATGLWLGHHAHLVHYPLRRGQLVNIVAIVSDSRPGESWAMPASPEEVRRRFEDFTLPARELLSIPREWLRWPLYIRQPLRVWPGRRALVIGDAAHPMVPFLAQGAAMAIEDAAVLARCLEEAGSIDSAIARFKTLRTARVARVQSEALRNGKIFHFGGLAGFARDMALMGMGASGLAAKYDWLYGFKA